MLANQQLDNLRDVAEVIIDLTTRATPDGLLADSPCAGWSGRDVLNHLVGAADLFAGAARGETMGFPDWSQMPD